MGTWRGIVGKSCKTPEEFKAYVDSVHMGDWHPHFVVVHNTSAPDLKTYNRWQTRTPALTDEQWAKNLEGYYKGMGWSAGPHLFCTPKSIIVFSPLTGPGTHSPAWNSITWGVEMVGEFEEEPFDGAIRDNAVAAISILHVKAGLKTLPYERGVKGLHFHKEDPKTTHKTCPGKHVVKEDMIKLVDAGIAKWAATG